MGRKSSINEELVVKTFKKLKSVPKTAKMLNIKYYQAHYILKKYKLNPSASEGHRIYEVDHKYFNKINTEEKAYWLGFLFADGCIVDSDGSKRLQVSLKSTDYKHLCKLKKSLSSSHPINHRIIKSGKMQGKEYCSLFIRSNELCDALIRLGCTPRKSLTLEFPKLSKNLISHFIRGYFDGDGSVFISKEKHWRSGKISEVIHYRFVGTENFLKETDKNINLNGYLHKIKGSNAFELMYKRNKKLKSFYNYLYQKSSIFLERKKLIFDLYLQERCSETIIS